MPISDIEILGNFSSSDRFNFSFIKDDPSASMMTQKLSFSSFSETRISFLIYSNNASTELGKQATIEWTIGGSEKNSYLKPLSTRVEIIDGTPFKSVPVVQTFTVSSTAGKATLSVTCSVSGTFYWAIGLNGALNNITVDKKHIGSQ